ncbi:hypothetical protein [Stutzerimonas stutzeri]|uniref:hypothetical protein n=1 Tax=Stutzerimonas stutzeri TaxID=316 RepID=UPI003722FEFC
MEMLIGLTILTFVCTIACLANLSGHDARQAALLPFADDPEAARQLTVETGLVCDRVVQPAEQPKQPDVWLA